MSVIVRYYHISLKLIFLKKKRLVNLKVHKMNIFVVLAFAFADSSKIYYTLPAGPKYDFGEESRKRGLRLDCWGLFNVWGSTPIRFAPRDIINYVQNYGIPCPDFEDNVNHYVVAIRDNGILVSYGSEQEARFYGTERFCFVDRETNEPVAPETAPEEVFHLVELVKKLVAEGSVVLEPPPSKMSSMESEEVYDAFDSFLSEVVDDPEPFWSDRPTDEEQYRDIFGNEDNIGENGMARGVAAVADNRGGESPSDMSERSLTYAAAAAASGP